LSGGIDKKNVITEIRSGDKRFATLKIPKKADTGEIQSKEFSRETKASAFIREALPGWPVCKICGGYLPSRFNSIDHITSWGGDREGYEIDPIRVPARTPC